MAGPPKRSFFSLKRVWTLIFLFFVCAWFFLIRFFAPRVGASRHAPRTISAPGGRAAPQLSRAAIFESLIVSARAGVGPVRDAAHYENDMGFCRVGVGKGAAAVSSALVYAAPTVCTPRAAAPARTQWSLPSAWLGGATPRTRGSDASAALISHGGSLTSVACVDAQRVDELISEARSALCREVAPAAEGALIRARAASSGRASGESAAETRAAPLALPIWSTPVCAFLARERLAADRDGAAATLEDEGLTKGVINACGVRITAADIAAKCGAAPDFDAVPVERTVDPYSRAAPQTFFLWNKALASASDVSPYVMVDDSYDFNETDYSAKLGAGTCAGTAASPLHSLAFLSPCPYPPPPAHAPFQIRRSLTTW